MTRSAAPHKNPVARKSAHDFVTQAFEIIAETGNYKDVTVDRLCARLGVSKGSFYWHFAGREGLLDALLADWSGQLHKNIHRSIEARSKGAPRELVEGVVGIWLGSNIGRIDQAMRQWALQEPKVAAAVADADQLLLQFLQNALLGMGFDRDDAFRRARIMMAIGIAEPQLAHLPWPNAPEHEVANVMKLLFTPATR